MKRFFVITAVKEFGEMTLRVIQTLHYARTVMNTTTQLVRTVEGLYTMNMPITRMARTIRTAESALKS